MGANATLVCGTTIGRYALIGAGAVVAQDVPDYALMLGVPARQNGWVSRHGHPLRANVAGEFVCPETGWVYLVESGQLRCRDWPEDKALPAEWSEGKTGFQEFKAERKAASKGQASRAK